MDEPPLPASGTAQVILVIDDERELREIYTHKLTKAGFSVLFAADGETGLTIALEKKPDLILLDVLMPNMSGVDMLKKLRAKNDWGSLVPVIMLTNVEPTSETMNKDIAETAPTYYLIKSDTDPDDLIVKIRERLSLPI